MNKFLKSILIFTVLFSSPSFAGNSKLFSAGIPSLAPMLEDVTPAVVNIYTISETPQRNQLIDDPFLRKFFNIPGQQKSKNRNRSGLGSGVIINSKKGFVITNNHVIAKANDIIQWEGTQWNVAFDSSSVSDIQYFTNATTNIQYKWTGKNWLKSYEGEYRPSNWRVVI